MTLQKNCLQCNNIFYKKGNESINSWNEKRKFCSKECCFENKKGKDTWNKGKKGLQKWSDSQRLLMIGRFNGEKSSVWKGGRWRHYGRKVAFANLPNKCNNCNEIDLKKITCHHKDENIHNNNIENLEILCHKCHYRYHKKGKRASINTEFKKGSVPKNKKNIDMDYALKLRSQNMSYKKIGEILGLSKASIIKRFKTTIATA